MSKCFSTLSGKASVFPASGTGVGGDGGWGVPFLSGGCSETLCGAQPQLSSRSCLVFHPCFDLPAEPVVLGHQTMEDSLPTEKVELARLVQCSLLDPGQENLAGRIQTLTGSEVQLK